MALATAGPAWAQSLTAADVTTVLEQAVKAASLYSPHSVIAVSDREGYILGVCGVSSSPDPGSGSNAVQKELQLVNAIDKAATAAYLSSNQDAFTSRTAGFIIQPHFPPGVENTAPGPLTGVGLSSLPFSDVNHFRNPSNPAMGIANTSLSGNPGGMPLYKNGVLVGGVGVDSNSVLSALVYVGGSDVDEEIATIAQSGYAPNPDIAATQVLINGIRLPYADYSNISLGTTKLKYLSTTYPVTASPGKPFNSTTNSPFPGLPGEVRNPIIGSTLPPISGQPRLSQAEVATILRQAAQRASTTRGAIRNPAGSAAEVFVVVVDYYSSTTTPNVPTILGSFRTPDATIFSYDVAAQKARTALFFSTNSMAMSSRTVGFLAQGTYPPGIDHTAAGPYGPPTYGASATGFPNTPIFAGPYGVQVAVSLNPNNPPMPTSFLNPIPTTPINKFLANGITVFPGGFPLYRNGVLIGAVGVSGDGVDQDDLISASATVGFEAPDNIRADEFTYRGARLPYAKFPQNASL